MESTAFIPVWNIPGLRDKLKKLNKKAVKLGCAPVTMVETGKTDTYERKDEYGRKEIIPLVEVSVCGTPPKLNGWSLVGIVEFNINYKDPIIREVPGQTMPKKYRKATQLCEHCKSSRKRNEVFVVSNEKKTMQIGRQCLADFLGHHSPEHFLFYASFVKDLEATMEEYGDRIMGGDRNPFYELSHVLAMTNAVIKQYGYISRKMAEERDFVTPTSSYVAAQVFYRRNLKADELIHITPQDEKEIKPVIRWMKKLNDSNSTYLHTLKQVGKAGIVDHSTLGIVASAITAYMRDNEQLQKKKSQKPSDYIGTVGKREVFEVRHLATTWVEGLYGTLAIIRFMDKDGNVLVWKTHSCPADFETPPESLQGIGSVTRWFTVKATVKKHDEYRETKQTEVSRLVVEGVREERMKKAA